MKNFILVLIISGTLVACAEGDLPDTQKTQASVAPSIQPQAESVVPTISISASLSQIAIKQVTSFNASGGTAPYTYAVVGTSAGAISSNVYTASIVGETITVRATDAKGYSADAQISVTWPTLKNIYRGKAGNGIHYYTGNTGDGVYANYGSQGVGYRMLQDPIDDQTKPIYRCLVSNYGIYFQSDKQNCESPNATSYVNQGILGYIYKTARPGLVPIQRFAGGLDHVDSIKGNQDSDVGGYSAEGIQGYALAPAAN